MDISDAPRTLEQQVSDIEVAMFSGNDAAIRRMRIANVMDTMLTFFNELLRNRNKMQLTRGAEPRNEKGKEMSAYYYDCRNQYVPGGQWEKPLIRFLLSCGFAPGEISHDFSLRQWTDFEKMNFALRELGMPPMVRPHAIVPNDEDL